MRPPPPRAARRGSTLDLTTAAHAETLAKLGRLRCDLAAAETPAAMQQEQQQLKQGQQEQKEEEE